MLKSVDGMVEVELLSVFTHLNVNACHKINYASISFPTIYLNYTKNKYKSRQEGNIHLHSLTGFVDTDEMVVIFMDSL